MMPERDARAGRRPGGARSSAILLVEQDESVHDALTDLLVGEGFDVVHAFDGIEARQRFLERADIAVVLFDGNLPGPRGWGVFGPAWRRRPWVSVILVTTPPESSDQADAAGIIARMEKPLDPALLIETLRRALIAPAR
jgi:DNA-binding NtrC family response regulator